MATIQELTDKIKTAVGDDSGLGKSLKFDLKDAGVIHIDGGSVTNEDKPADLTMTLSLDDLLATHNATLPRLSHVVRRLEDRGFVDRTRNSTDARATNAHLTEAGLAHLVDSAPGHVEIVREKIFDVLTPEQVTQLGAITTALLDALDPEGRMTGHTIGSHRPSSKE